MLDSEGATVIEENIPAEVETRVEEPKQMEDTIRETLRSIQEKSGETVETKIPESPEEKAERIRNKQGQFAKPEAPTADKVAKAPKDLAPTKSAPNTWKKDQAAKFAKLDPDVQDEILRREGDFFKGIEQYKTKAQFGDVMERAITPHLQTLQSLGVSPDKAVSELLQADHKLRYGSPAEKAQMFAYLAQSYGIDPRTVPETQQTQIDPTVQALREQVQQLNGWVQNYQLMGQQKEEQALTGEINQFASDPKNRHFESVRNDMAALLQAGIAANLQDAYERAIYANPQTRALVLAEQQAAERAKATQTAQAARTAASVNVRKRPSMPVSQPIGSMDDTIRATFRRLTNA